MSGVALMAVGLGGLVVIDARHDTLRALVVDRTLLWWAVMFVGFVVAVVSNERQPITVRQLWTVAILSRLVLLITEPTLSDDVYRYLWEGHLVTEGVSPYAFPIDDPAATVHDIPARSLANNRSLASPYLPLAHLVFGAAALVLPSAPWTMQLLMVVFDLVAIAGLIVLLERLELPTHRAVLYAWNPLVIVEVAHGAHLDAMITALALWGIVATIAVPKHGPAPGVRSLAGPVLAAAAVLSRPIAAVFAPVLFWRWNRSQRLVAAATVSVPVLVAGAVSGFGLRGGDGTGVFGSAQAYVRHFRFNSAIYQRLETWIGGRGLDDRGWNEPMSLTRLAVYGTVAVAMAVIFWRARRLTDDRSMVRFLLAPFAVYVLAAPVLHPWYLLVGLALATTLAPAADEPDRRWLLLVPWPVLGALSTLSYLTYEQPDAFAERTWVTRVVWYPTLVLAAVAVGAAVTLRTRASRPIEPV